MRLAGLIRFAPASLLGVALLASAPAQARAAQSAATVLTVPTTRVLAIGHLTGTADRAAMPSIMPREVRATVELYLGGKLDQWFVRKDGQGVVFLLNAGSAEEARQILGTLPLVKAGRMQFDLIPLGPLSPLRYLMAEPQQDK